MKPLSMRTGIFAHSNYRGLLSAVPFLFLLAPYCVYSQGNTLIRLLGKIQNEHSNPLPYVSVHLKGDCSIGVASSSGGDFEIKLPPSSINDTLLFSCIGYEDFTFPVKNFSSISDLTIILKTKIYLLNEVVITPDSITEIVKDAVRKLKTNLPTTKSILQGFYREIIRSDNTYDRLIEAAIDVLDYGYKTNYEKSLQFKVRELRKSEDYRDMDWMMSVLNYIQPKNSLHGNFESLFDNDYIRNNKAPYVIMVNAPLSSEEFYNDVNFTLDSITYFGTDKILSIGISPKNDSSSFLPFGIIHIRDKDHAIFQMELGVKVNPKVDVPFAIPGQDFIHHTIIKYREYDNKLFLNFLHRKAFRFEINGSKLDKSKRKKSQAKEGFFYQECLFTTNEIITEKNKIVRFRKKERQNRNIDLYSERCEYNESFWKTYNSINERPLEPNVKKDIEREIDLEEQFKKIYKTDSPHRN